MWVDHMKIRKNSGIENSHIFNLEGTADKILDFFLRRKRVLAKYTKEEKQKAIDLYIRYSNYYICRDIFHVQRIMGAVDITVI